MPLTSVGVKNLRAKAKAYSLSDGGGLHIRVSPNGSKLWRLAYRHGGTQKLVSFGPFPSVSLLDAREYREEAKRLLRQGNDPARVRAERKRLQSHDNSFRAAAVKYSAGRSDVSDHTAAVYQWYISSVIDADFCDRPLSEISPTQVRDLLLRIDASGRKETARRVRWFIGRVFQHANAMGNVVADPTIALKGVLPKREKKSYAAITDRRKFGGLMRAIEEFDGWPTVKSALLMAAFCFLRPGFALPRDRSRQRSFSRMAENQ